MYYIMFITTGKALPLFHGGEPKTDSCNPEIHAAAFAFQQWVKRLLPKEARDRRRAD